MYSFEQRLGVSKGVLLDGLLARPLRAHDTRPISPSRPRPAMPVLGRRAADLRIGGKGRIGRLRGSEGDRRERTSE